MLLTPASGMQLHTKGRDSLHNRRLQADVLITGHVVVVGNSGVFVLKTNCREVIRSQQSSSPQHATWLQKGNLQVMNWR
jgi:hypothetical protein